MTTPKYLYLLTRPIPPQYNGWVSAVVCARNAQVARGMHPCGIDRVEDGERWSAFWVERDQVTVTIIGTAESDIPVGVVCASFKER